MNYMSSVTIVEQMRVTELRHLGVCKILSLTSKILNDIGQESDADITKMIDAMEKMRSGHRSQ